MLPPVAGLIDGLMIQNTVGVFIVAFQGVCALFMAGAIIHKTRQVGNWSSVMRRFRRDFDTSANVLSIYFERRNDGRTPVEAIYRASCERLLKLIQPEARARMYDNSFLPQDAALSPREVALVDSACERMLGKQLLSLDSGMGLISTCVSLTPMLGLLGTVWGVLDAFGDMEPGAAMMQKLAPSISAALVTTVIGLIIAIPGVAAYNWLNAGIRKLSDMLESMSDEVCGRIACEFQGGGD